MKVLIVQADSGLGQQMAMRFRRAGHQVISLYHHNMKKAEYKNADKGQIIYRGITENKLNDILKYETPEMMILLYQNVVYTELEAEEKIRVVSMAARLSARFKVQKVIFLSTLEVYKLENMQEITEESPAEPRTLNGKTAYACEHIIEGFRSEEGLQSVYLRIGDVIERGRPTAIWKALIEAANKNTGVPAEYISSEMIPVHEGDLTDAVLRSVSDFIKGVYNISGEYRLSSREIYEAYQVLKEDNSVENLSSKTYSGAPSAQKAMIEMGWVRKYSTMSILKDLLEEKTKDKSGSRSKKNILSHEKEKIQTYFESVGVFILIALLQWNLPVKLGFEPLLLYVIGASALGGLSHGLFSVVLVIGYHLYEMSFLGFTIDAVILHHTFLLSNLAIIAMTLIIGYVVERKDAKVEKAEEDFSLAVHETERIYQINEELAEAKQLYEEKLMGYEDGIARLYKVFQSLEMKSLNEILLHAPRAMSELTGEKHIGIYTVQKKSGFIRKLSSIGDIGNLVPTAFRYLEFESYRRVVDQKQLYLNRQMDPSMPSLILPITVRGEVIALVVLYAYSFEKFTSYHLNLIKIAGEILSNFSEKMSTQKEIISSLLYEDNGLVMQASFFEQACLTAESASRESFFQYDVLELYTKDPELLLKTRNLLRDSDEIGRLSNNHIGLLLYGTRGETTEIVQKRLQGLGIESKVIT